MEPSGMRTVIAQIHPKNPNDSELRTAADWARVDLQGRLVLPADVVGRISWITRKQSTAVLLRLAKRGQVFLRSPALTFDALTQERGLIGDIAQYSDSRRRLAFSYHLTREGVIEGTTGRLKLRPAVLLHLQVEAGDSLFCLAYDDMIEIINAAMYDAAKEEYDSDISL